MSIVIDTCEYCGAETKASWSETLGALLCKLGCHKYKTIRASAGNLYTYCQRILCHEGYMPEDKEIEQ